MLINDLDDDTLLYILDHIAREDENGAFLIISVCARWEGLALQTKTIWRYITLADCIEDWDARLAIATTLACGKSLIVKAFFPVSATRFSALLKYQILHLSIHTVPSVECNLEEVFSFLLNHLRFRRRDAIRRISWYGEKFIPQPIYIPSISSALHMYVAQNLPDAFTTTVEQYPSALLSHFSVDTDYPSPLRGDVLMKCLSNMGHLVSLRISERMLIWDKPESSKIWTLSRLEELDYTFHLVGGGKPHLCLNVPRLSKLEISTHYFNLLDVFPNFMGLTNLGVLTLNILSVALPSTDTTALPVGLTHINSINFNPIYAHEVTQEFLHSFTASFMLLFRNVSVYQWNLSSSCEALGSLSLLKVPFDKIRITSNSGIVIRRSSVTKTDDSTATSESNPATVCSEVTVGTEAVFAQGLFKNLPVAKKLVIEPGFGWRVETRFSTRFTSQIQELYVSSQAWSLYQEPPAHLQTFASLNRLSAPLDIVKSLFTENNLPVLEELVAQYPFSTFEFNVDEELEALALVFIEGRSGVVLARLHTLGVNWWPRWNIIEMLLDTRCRLHTKTSPFTLKLPARPHPRVLEPLVDIICGITARWPLPVIAGQRNDGNTGWAFGLLSDGANDDFIENSTPTSEECPPCTLSGFTCTETHPAVDPPLPSQLFAVTENTYIGEYETYERV